MHTPEKREKRQLGMSFAPRVQRSEADGTSGQEEDRLGRLTAEEEFVLDALRSGGL